MAKDNPSTLPKAVGIRMEPSLASALKAEAKARGVSLATLIADLWAANQKGSKR